MQATDTRKNNFKRVPDVENVLRDYYIGIDLGHLGVWHFELDKKIALKLAKGVIESFNKESIKKGL